MAKSVIQCSLRNLVRKEITTAKKTYIFYNTTLDMIGDEIAYKTMTVEGTEKALHKKS